MKKKVFLTEMAALALTFVLVLTGYPTGNDDDDGGIDKDDPIPLTKESWADLLAGIKGKGKYVALDLSLWTMEGTEFDAAPGESDAGESLIVSLILPDVATSIKAAGSAAERQFRHFTGLVNVRGDKIETIGERAFQSLPDLKEASFPEATVIKLNAFYGCDSLTEVKIPKATSIEDGAFWACDDLKEVDFPDATSIGEQAFYACYDLTTVNFPKAESIEKYAFYGRNDLTEVSFPEVASIGEFAFYGCTNLKTVDFPEATSIGDWAFNGCTGLTEVSFPKATSIGVSTFSETGEGALTVILPQAAPTVTGGYLSGDYSKTVTVKTPADRTGYDEAWQTDFKRVFGTSRLITLKRLI